MAQVRLNDVVKTYGDVYAVDGVSLTVEDGEFGMIIRMTHSIASAPSLTASGR